MEKDVLHKLYDVVLDRKENYEEGSYTCYLFKEGLDKILKKCGEECSEMIIASKNDSDSELVGEISDLFYHIMVLMVQRGIKLDSVMDLLNERSKKISNLKTFHKVDKNT